MAVVLKELHFQPTAFAHEAAYAGYKYYHDYREEVVNHIRKMQIKLVNGLNNMPYPVKANLPEATYLVWADFNDTGWSGDRIQEFLVQDAGLGFNREISLVLPVPDLPELTVVFRSHVLMKH